MATIIHDGALERLAADEWPGLVVKVGLLHETSTAVPATTDEFVSDLIPAANELVNDDYERVTLAGKVASLVSGAFELGADTPNFGALTGATLTHGVLTWFAYAHVGTDTANWLIASRTFTSPVTLNGTDVTIPWPDGVVLRLERA